MTDNNLNTTLKLNGKQNNMSLTNKTDLYDILIDAIKKEDKSIDKSIENKIKLLIDIVNL